MNYLEENGPDNPQPQTRAPSRGGWAKNERADMTLAVPEDEIAKPAQYQPETLAFYLEPWRELYERRQRRIGPGGSQEVIGHRVDSRPHASPLSESSDTSIRRRPIAGYAPTVQDEGAERLGHADE